MKLLTHEQYEKLSPVKRSVYEKRVQRYYGVRQMNLATEPWIFKPNTRMLFRSSISGLYFMTTKDFLDANVTAANILMEMTNEEVTAKEALERLLNEVGP